MYHAIALFTRICCIVFYYESRIHCEKKNVRSHCLAGTKPEENDGTMSRAKTTMNIMIYKESH